MRALPWIFGGGAVTFAAYVWTRRDGDASADAPREAQDDTGPLSGRWVWPVGVWHDRKPEISDGFTSSRRAPSGEVIRHGGVDLMYLRVAGDRCQRGTPNGSRGYT